MTKTEEIMEMVDKYSGDDRSIYRDSLPAYNTLKSAIEELVADAEKFRAYKARKDEVIAAGMGRNPLRSANAEVPDWMIDASNGPSDTQRLDWALPILTGHDSENADRLAMNLAMQLMHGLDGRAAIDAAMKEAL